MTTNFIKIRDGLINDGVLVEIEGLLEFPEDYLFSSPSTAAAIVLGRNANGLTEWKLKSGISLKEFESGKSK